METLQLCVSDELEIQNVVLQVGLVSSCSFPQYLKELLKIWEMHFFSFLLCMMGDRYDFRVCMYVCRNEATG